MSRRDEVLVSTDWVAAHADDPAYRLVEVDEDTAAYAGGHIRNAIAWHWRDDLHDAPRRDFLDQDAPVGAPARSGVGPDTTVVLYGGNNNWFATYAYWLLRYLGFDRVKLVDGGRKKWELEDRELVDRRARPRRGRPRRRSRRCAHELRAFRDDVLDAHRRRGQDDGGRPQPGRVLRRGARAAAPAPGAGPGARPHPGRGQRALGERGPARTAPSRATGS